ncbi:hypothetical protein F5B20DRAFT_575598 [Whalleya microplaca]|nr:hypothetical protein F5B20DRAFT_575598 [Whalleya microplaca]
MNYFLLLMAITAHISLSSAAGGPSPTTRKTTSTATSSSAAVTHTVKVGLQHDFQPDTIQANPGDTIHFNFYPKNHSVARAAFKNPCIPWELTQFDGETFFSGAIEQETAQNPLPSWELRVNHTDPVFFYCSAPGSCINYSMVGVINPNDTFTLAIQKDYVKNTTFQLSPGEAFPDEAPPSATSSGVAAPTSTGDTDSGGNAGHSTLSGGAIAGIVIGATAGFAIAIALVYFCGRKGGIKKGYRRSGFANPPAPPEIIEAKYDDEPKSPPLHSPYTVASSTGAYHRSPSPAAWSAHDVGSPRTSYLGPSPQHLSPGFSPYGGPIGPDHGGLVYFEGPDSQKPIDPPAVELPASPPAHPPPRY